MPIELNTFSAACYDTNSIEELEQALVGGPDSADMKEWNLSEAEWRESVIAAVAELKADS
ncbi:MAG: hypothetical protein GY799_29595 [Desulfobulbaceae bacterium]|nr:hypothetical protein [Desulfobulbaceae bacterium]